MSSGKIIRDFTTGPILLPLTLFALPFMISNALQVLYSTVDMFIVGRIVGSTALASVTNASKICTLVTMVSLGLATSGQVYISQLVGQGRRRDLGPAIGTLFGFLFIAGIVFGVAGCIFANEILELMEVPEEAFAGARSYLLICSAGAVFTYGYNMVSAVFRGMGDSRHPFIFVAIASVLNIILDLLFVGHLGFGVAGSAIATIISQAVSFIFAVQFLRRSKDELGFKLSVKLMKIDPKVLGPMMKLALPFVIRFAAVNLSMLFVNKLVNSQGLAASAMFGIGVQMDDIVTKVTQGVMMASTAVVGQNFGARKPDRVRMVILDSWLLSFGFYVVYTAFLLGMPERMFGIFTDSAEVKALAPLFAYTIVWQFPGLILMRGTNGFINGIGAAKLGLVLGLLDGVILRIGMSYFFGICLGWGLRGFILGYAIACYGMSIPALCYLLFFNWQKRMPVTQS